MSIKIEGVQKRLCRLRCSSATVCDSYVYSSFNYKLKQKKPEIWKCAHITPVQKQESKAFIENYRPFSLLTKISLILEKFLFDLIYFAVEDKINYRLHGFRIGYSTVTHVSMFLNKSYQKNCSFEFAVVYLNFSKAFDTVDHSLLFFKLIRFEFDENVVDLLSYLKHRSERVTALVKLCNNSAATSGVPQGIVMGPLFSSFSLTICLIYRIFQVALVKPMTLKY